MKCMSCGKELPQGGSLTQWLGLGDFCKCSILENCKPDSTQPKETLCPFCGLHLKHNTGSMTQWAFRRETCTCLPVLTNPRSEPETAQALFVNPPLLTAGSKIGRHYQVISFIGEGGASAVYKVKHQHLEKEFAVKVLLPNRIPTGSMLKRFQQEGRSIGRLKHKHIVSVHEFGVDENNQPFLVMDYLEGKTLSDLIKDTGGLEPIRAAAIFQQIAEALEHAHANSVIHRDLKPNNVIIVHDEKGQETVKLVDFGIAKLEEEASLQDTLTKTGEIFGSPHYMSPEQCKGRALDARADVYSFGCLMYETLTGTPAAQADTVFDILMLHLNGLSINLDQTECGITLHEKSQLKKTDGAMQYKCFTGLKQIIDGCIQALPERRYPSTTSIKKDLALVRGGNDPQGPSASSHSLAQKYLAKRLGAREEKPTEAGQVREIKTYIFALVVCLLFLLIALARYGMPADRNVQTHKIFDPYIDTVVEAANILEEKMSQKRHASTKQAKSSGTELSGTKHTAGEKQMPDATLPAANECHPVTAVSAPEFLGYNDKWNLLASDDDGITVQIDKFNKQSLKTLDAISCDAYIIRAQRVNDELFAAIASLKNVKRLYLCDCTGITPQGLKELGKSRRLKSIHFHNMTISQDWIPVLCKLPLNAISFKDSLLSAEMVNAIADTPQIKYINLETQNAAQEHTVRLGNGWVNQTTADGSQWYCRLKPEH